ncbi:MULTISPECIES: hypothetical protein [Streptomyces]|uniref:Uncharacterized protein n=1 Tax=Streptomyces milbemycinicus TaxID=476552 RepID=A0ABW8MB59_9ACTN|nr:hypothetical protein [Streptomyces hygroscopicus]GLV73986.1 hypothetical protein Shyhy02_19880 [Streptomyces hygroscopicus subsp. hygroscopicus]
MKRTVRLSAEYECYPVWVITEQGLDNVAPDSLPLSKQLIEDLNRWGDEYEATYNRDDPITSGFTSEAAEQRFVERGHRLARRLRDELDGTWCVSYFDQSTASHVEIE